MSTERTAPGWKADRQTAAEGSSGAGRLKRMCVGFPGSSRYRISTPDLSGGHEIYRPVLYNEGGTADFRPSRSEIGEGISYVRIRKEGENGYFYPAGKYE